MSSPSDRRVTDLDRHLDPGPINRHSAVREHLQLTTSRDDREALLDRSSSHRLVVVHDDTERTADEISHQQIGTVAGELEESTIKRHEVLSASQAGVTCQIAYNINYYCSYHLGDRTTGWMGYQYEARMINVQYTPPTPTRRNCRVASCRRCEHTADATKLSRRRCEHTRQQSWRSLQFPVLTTDKWRHCWKNCKNSRILHYTADSNVYKHAALYVTSYPTSITLAAELLVTALGCVHIAESVGSRRELVANSCTHRWRRRDATKQFRSVGVGGVYWA